MNPSVRAQVTDGNMCLKVRVLLAVCLEGLFVNGVRLAKTLFHAAVFPMDLANDVEGGIGNAGRGFFRMQDRRASAHGLLGIKDGRQDFVIYLQQAAGFLGGAFGLRDDRSKTLSHEPNHIVEDVGVIRFDAKVVVRSRAVRQAWNVFPGKNGMHAGDGHRLVPANRQNARMRMRRAQHLKMQHFLHTDICGVMGVPGDDGFAERIAEISAGAFSGAIGLHMRNAVNGILDGVIARAAAKIAFQPEGQILLVFLGEGCGGHDHPRRAETAGKPFERGDFTPLRAESRHEAAMHRLAIEPDRAGATVTGITAFFHAEPSQIAYESAQALPRPGLSIEGLSVDCVAHANSSRICSA